jgi:hypothetical protein
MRNSMCRIFGVSVFFAVLAGISTSVLASPLIVPAGDEDLRSDLSWLADRGVITLSTSTWPISVDAIEEALDHATTAHMAVADESAMQRVRQTVERLQDPTPQIEFGAKTNSSKLPRSFQEEPIGNQDVSASSSWANRWVGGTLDVDFIRHTPYATGNNFNLDGSYIGTEAWGQLLYFGRVNHYWGPGDTGSLGFGDASRPVTGLSLQRASTLPPKTPWMSWVGPWTYQIFAGREQDYTAVPNTRLFGMRLTIKPFNAIEFGVQRTWQWGGGTQPGGLGAWWKDFIGNSGISPGSIRPANKPGVQQGGFDIRWNTALFGNPLALYGETGGSDGGGGGRFHAPSRNAYLLGTELKTLIGASAVTWRLEAADTQASRLFGLTGSGVPNSVYTGVVWTDGYYQQGLPLGYPIGGDGRLFSAAAQVTQPDGIRYGAQVLHMMVNEGAAFASHRNNALYPNKDTISALVLNVSYPLSFGKVRATVTAQHSQFAHRYDGAAMVTLDIDLARLRW